MRLLNKILTKSFKKSLLFSAIFISIGMMTIVCFGFNPGTIPTDLLRGVSHKEIVEFAILGSATSPDIRSPGPPGNGGVVWQMFPDLVPGQVTQPMSDAISRIVDGVKSNDSHFDPDHKNPAAHFDNEFFGLSLMLIQDRTEAALNHLNRSEWKEASYAIGKALHTIHDFYAHTNWVELHKTEFLPALSPPFDFRFGGNSLEASNHESCDVDLINTEKLTSGYYGNYRPAFPAPIPPGISHPNLYDSPPTFSTLLIYPKQPGKCIHGAGFLPNLLGLGDTYKTHPINPFDRLYTSPENLNWGINKDTVSRDHSPHSFLSSSDTVGSGHTVAARLAADATRDYLLKFRQVFFERYPTPESIIKLRTLFGVNFGFGLKVTQPTTGGNFDFWAGNFDSKLGAIHLFASQSGFFPLDEKSLDRFKAGGQVIITIVGQPDGATARFLNYELILPPGWSFVTVSPSGSIDPDNPSVYGGRFIDCRGATFCNSHRIDQFLLKYDNRLAYNSSTNEGQFAQDQGETDHWAVSGLIGDAAREIKPGSNASPKDSLSLTAYRFAVRLTTGFVNFLNDIIDSAGSGQEAWAADLLGSAIRTDIFSVEQNLDGGTVSHNIPVDSSINSIVMKVHGSPNVRISDPGGRIVDVSYPSVTITSTSSSFVAAIENPLRGTWNISIDGTGTITTEVTGFSTISFLNAGFGAVEETIHPGFTKAQSNPIAGGTSSLYGEISSLVRNLEIQLRTPSGVIIGTYPVALGGNGTEFLLSEIQIPIDTFFIYAHGLSTSDEEYLRVLPFAQVPSTIQVASNFRYFEIEESGQAVVQFNITNHGNTQRDLSFNVTSRKATILEVTPSSATIPSGATSVIDVKVAPSLPFVAFSSGHVIFSVTDNVSSLNPVKPIDVALAYLPASNVIVPNVTDISLVAAQAALNNLGLGSIEAQQPSDTAASGVVLSQSPAAGTATRLGGVVQLVVSSGPAIVPHLVGLPLSQARASINDQRLLIGQVTETSDLVIPAGLVKTQNPPANTQVTLGSAINLEVSLGAAVSAVPNVVGLSQTNAEAAIIAATLAVGSVTQTNSSTVPAGEVISQSPTAGAVVAQGSSVNLVISSGASSTVNVPNVVDLSQSSAQSAITGAGLVVGTVTQASSSTVPAGSVISQDPSAGTSVAADSAVNLVISSGAALVTVPNVVGLSQSSAQSAITGAGLVVGTVTQASSSTVPAGSVISQDPSAGTSVAPGSAVNFVISSGAGSTGGTGDQGCGTGYWKNHPGSWPASYASTKVVSSVFSSASAAPYGSLGSSTLMEALRFKGGNTLSGAGQILLRAAVAALLNAEHSAISYPKTAAQVISDVNSALASGNRAMILGLASKLDVDNNLACPLGRN